MAGGVWISFAIFWLVQVAIIIRGVEGINTRGRPAEFTLELAAKDAGLINDIAAATGMGMGLA